MADYRKSRVYKRLQKATNTKVTRLQKSIIIESQEATKSLRPVRNYKAARLYKTATGYKLARGCRDTCTAHLPYYPWITRHTGLARIIYIWGLPVSQRWPHIYIYGVCAPFLAGNSPNVRSLRCIYTVLANPIYVHKGLNVSWCKAVAYVVLARTVYLHRIRPCV